MELAINFLAAAVMLGLPPAAGAPTQGEAAQHAAPERGDEVLPQVELEDHRITRRQAQLPQAAGDALSLIQQRAVGARYLSAVGLQEKHTLIRRLLRSALQCDSETLGRITTYEGLDL